VQPIINCRQTERQIQDARCSARIARV